MSPIKPNRTACKVALNILTLGAKLEMADVLPSGILDATEKILLASGAASERTVRWTRSPKMLSVYKGFDWMMPGQFEAFGYRKMFFEDHVRQAIARGSTQVLVLGGGYDTLGWRLADEYPDVGFFEVDHPATALLKTSGIEKMGSRENLHLIPEDLSIHKLDDVLSSDKSWERGRRTIILAEGLLQYLSPAVVDDLFWQCAQVADECVIVFTFISTRNDGRPDAGLCSRFVLWLLKKGGEPWLWSVHPEKLGLFLKERGWGYAPELVDINSGKGVEFYGAATKNCH